MLLCLFSLAMDGMVKEVYARFQFVGERWPGS